MSNHLPTAILATTLIAASVSAQSNYMPSNTPNSGTCNVIPFGTVKTSSTWRNQKYQTLATKADLGNVTAGNICDIAFAPCGTLGRTGNIHFDTIEIVLAQKKTALVSNFNTNLEANVVTVLKATNYDWHVTAGVWNRIGFDKTYNYIPAAFGDNLVIQITVTGNHKTGSVGTGFHRDSTHIRLYHFNWTTAPNATGSLSKAALKFEVGFEMADLHTFGIGCKGSNGVPKLALTGSAKLAGSVGITVTNCVANAPALHVFGFTRFEPRIDLVFAGAPGCFLYESVDLLLGAVANASGSYGFKLTVPNDKNLICTRVYTQGFPADTVNAFGRTASNYGRILVGN